MRQDDSRFHPTRGYSIWGTLDALPPWKLRKMVAIRRRIGPVRYKTLRLSMSNAHNHLTLIRLMRELGILREQL